MILNLTSYIKVIDLKKLPISFSASLGLEPIHPNVMGWGSLLVITIAVLVSVISGTLAYWECTLCHNLQARSDETLQHGKAYLNSLKTICHEEQEISSLIGSNGLYVLQVQTPVVDLELVCGFGDESFDQQEECYSDSLDIGDDKILSMIENVDTEIITGIGDSQEFDQYSLDAELLHGVGDAGVMATLVKINSVLKLNNA